MCRSLYSQRVIITQHQHTAMASGSDSNFLLYPELMSKDDLISVLKQRYIQNDNLAFMDKYELVELYNKYILPLPQRKYRMNRRGREMIKKQILASKKRRLTSVDETDGHPEAKRKSTGNVMTSVDVPAAGGDRLKPPPSCIDKNKKKIKLNSSSKSDTCVSSTLVKHKLNSTSHSISTSSVKKIKLNSSGPEEPTGETAENCDLHTETETCVSTEEEDLSKKSKITKIKWP